jgi:hypothetical protein
MRAVKANWKAITLAVEEKSIKGELLASSKE